MLNGPISIDYDLTAFKEHRTRQRIRWQLRFESFNTFNHAQFLYPARMLILQPSE